MCGFSQSHAITPHRRHYRIRCRDAEDYRTCFKKTYAIRECAWILGGILCIVLFYGWGVSTNDFSYAAVSGQCPNQTIPDACYPSSMVLGCEGPIDDFTVLYFGICLVIAIAAGITIHHPIHGKWIHSYPARLWRENGLALVYFFSLIILIILFHNRHWDYCQPAAFDHPFCSLVSSQTTWISESCPGLFTNNMTMTQYGLAYEIPMLPTSVTLRTIWIKQIIFVVVLIVMIITGLAYPLFIPVLLVDSTPTILPPVLQKQTSISLSEIEVVTVSA